MYNTFGVLLIYCLHSSLAKSMLFFTIVEEEENISLVDYHKYTNAADKSTLSAALVYLRLSTSDIFYSSSTIVIIT